MVLQFTCECCATNECEVDSLFTQNKFENFFFKNIRTGTFIEEKPGIPYYTFDQSKWYADKWYRCTVCGCLWEYVKPDFPASGFVRKFTDGSYFEMVRSCE